MAQSSNVQSFSGDVSFFLVMEASFPVHDVGTQRRGDQVSYGRVPKA